MHVNLNDVNGRQYYKQREGVEKGYFAPRVKGLGTGNRTALGLFNPLDDY